MTAPVDDLSAALAATGRLVAAIGPDEWGLPTPCTGWSVHDVVNHLVAGNRLFVRVLGGEQLPAREELIAASRTDQLGGDAAAAYRDSATALTAAFRADGTLERMVTVPAGTVPGIAALHLRTVEALVHGWDLARATGREVSVPDGLVERELAFTRDMLPRVTAPPAGQGPFAPSRPVPDGAPALDRLAALLGRPVDG